MTHANHDEMIFSAARFTSTVSGSSGGEYAAWFFDRVRSLTQGIEQRLSDAIEFKVDHVAAVIQGCAADMEVLLTTLSQVEEHCKNLKPHKVSIQNARLRIEGTLRAHGDYINAACRKLGGVDVLQGA